MLLYNKIKLITLVIVSYFSKNNCLIFILFFVINNILYIYRFCAIVLYLSLMMIIDNVYELI